MTKLLACRFKVKIDSDKEQQQQSPSCLWMTALGSADVGVVPQAMWMEESYKLTVLPSYLTPLVPSPAGDLVCEALDSAWFTGSLGRARIPLVP